MTCYPPRAVRIRSFGIVFVLLMLVCAVLYADFFKADRALAQVSPTIRYSASSNTVYIGRPYTMTIPAEAPYVGYPSHPAAPKLVITLPQLAALLNKPALITDQGNGIWLVKVNLVIYQNTRLEVTSPTIRELRLESILTNATTKKYTKVVASGGQLLIQGVKVNSWNTPANTVDTSYQYGRSYLAALYGARMDIINSEASYLGWYEPNPGYPDAKIGKGEPSGLAWRLAATPSDPLTKATGSIVNSLVHHNYYGNYTYQTINMVFTGNQVYANIYYGFDPHDYSTNMEIAGNEFYNNGYHGLILSRGCTNNRIHDNKMYNNAGHGLMLDRGSDDNQVYNNEIYGNIEDGLAIYESSRNAITNNTLRDNKRYGLRINAVYDGTDVFDGLAIDNVIQGNTITGNTKYGVNFYERADRNVLLNNTISNNGDYGLYINTGGNRIQGNTITGNVRDGLYVLGGLLSNPAPGQTPIVPAVDTPGHANQVIQNTIKSNKLNGISLITMATDTRVTTNIVESNLSNGVYIKGVDSKRNWVSQNSITGNSKLGVSVDKSATSTLVKPSISSIKGKVVSGTAKGAGRQYCYAGCQ
ncbi:MAG: right-handed parallel beta-helix repeat-containing protein [Chloroflexi bacterium]|nr:right-handed parallel beta-helix repeat-containing protein [Chloroflexota bacterium]